jgi:hypothetical protein
MPGFLVLALLEVFLFVATSLLLKPKLPKGIAPNILDRPGSKEGNPWPVVFGTMLIPANVVHFSDVKAVEESEKISTGPFSSHRVTVGYSYSAIAQVLLCHGPVDALLDVVWQDTFGLNGTRFVTEMTDGPDGKHPVQVGKDYTIPDIPFARGDPDYVSSATGDPNDVDAGSVIILDAPELFGGYQHGGGIQGACRMFWGTATQKADPTLAHVTGIAQADFPAYRGLAHAVLGTIQLDDPSILQRFNFGEMGTVPALAFLVRRCPSALGVPANINGGANLAECIYEVLTNTVWGLCIPASEIETSTFVASGNTLAAEGFAFHSALMNGESGEAILNELVRYADANVQQNPITGKLEMTLNRKDYDVSTLVDLNDDNATSEITRPSWAPLVNQVKVTYTGNQGVKYKDVTTQPIDDIASQREYGVVNSLTVPFPGVRDPVLAVQLGVRSLRTAATPLAKAKITTNRTAAGLKVGSPFKLTNEIAGVNAHVFRVLSIDFGKRTDGKIEIDAIEDIFNLESPLYGTPIDPPGTWSGVGPTNALRIIPTAWSDGSRGYLELEISGGDGLLQSVQFQEQSGNADVTDWHDNIHPTLFHQEVDLDEKHPSLIGWRCMGHLKDGTTGALADGKADFPVATRPGRPLLSSAVHSSGWADLIIDTDQDAVAVKVAQSYEESPTYDDVLATPSIDLPPGEHHLVLNHESFLDAEHPVVYFGVVALDESGNAGPLATITINAIRPEQYVTPTPSFEPVEVEGTAVDGKEEGCMHIPVQFEFNTDSVEIFARQSELDPDAPVGIRPPDLATNSQAYIVRRQEGLIPEDDNWRTLVHIATHPGFYRRFTATGVGPTGLRGKPFSYTAQCLDSGTAPTAPPHSLSVTMSTVAGRARATLTWVNGDSTADILVERNEFVLARLVPGTTTLIDDGLSPETKEAYKIQHIKNGQTTDYADATEVETDVPQLESPVWATGYPQSAGYDSTVLIPPPNGRVRIKATAPDILARIQVWMNDREGGGGTYGLKAISSTGVIDIYLKSNLVGLPNPKDEERSFYLVAIRDGYSDSNPSPIRTAVFGFA